MYPPCLDCDVSSPASVLGGIGGAVWYFSRILYIRGYQESVEGRTKGENHNDIELIYN